MRKLLIIVLIIILLAAFGVMLTSGIKIGNIEIPSIEQIIADNNELDDQIATLSNSINTTYASAKSSLSTSINELESAKQEYQDLITYTTEEELQAANQTEEYEIAYLWTKIGLFARNNNVTMQANVTSGTVSGLYNIAFTVTGEYLSISEFIYAIENDSSLGFKIENFTLVPYADDTLQATFTIKNIALNEDSLSNTTTVTAQSTSTENTVEE